MYAERFFPKSKLATAILLFSTFFLAVVFWRPIVQTFTWSFTEKFLFNIKWVGLQNYRNLVKDPKFWQSLGVTLRYWLMVMPFVASVGLLLAVLVNSIKNTTVRGFLTASYFMAYIVPVVAVSIVWRYIFLPTSQGLFNSVLVAVGLPKLRWLNDVKTALPSIAIVGIWKYIGYVLVIYLAGLQTIPDVFYEAAQVDGANRWQAFWHVTFPLLMPTIFFAVILTSLSTLMMFAEAYAMTFQGYGVEPGGPLGSTKTMVMSIWLTAFYYQKEGYASAMAVIFFVLMVGLSYLQARLMRAQFEY